MMTKETAIKRAHGWFASMARHTENVEQKTGVMAGMIRNNMGVLRRLMFEAGIPHEDLPEMPSLDPAHLEAWKAQREVREAA